MRDSFVNRGKVVIVQNTSNDTVGLWLYAQDRTTRFSLDANEKKEFGWLEGYEFGENSIVIIGGEGFAPASFRWGDK
jgi:hypothetical protein